MSRPVRKRNGNDSGVSSPAQEDEADIVTEVGASADESGELVADEAAIAAVGAVDAESVRENRRLDDMVGKKRANVQGVQFNTGDLIIKYETLLRVWPANTITISVRRLTGNPVQQLITSRPPSGADLWKELMALHGHHEEAKYEVKFFDENSKTYRGTGQITLPNMRVEEQQRHMTSPPYYPGAPPPAGYPSPYAPPPPPQALPQPQLVPAAPAIDPVVMMKQMFELFQQMQVPQQQPQPFAPPSPPPPPAMPPPPSTSDPAAMVTWMQQMFNLFQQMQTSARPAQAEAPAPPQMPVQAPNPMAAVMPPVQPPPGMMFVPGFGYVPVERLFQALSGAPAAPSAPSSPFRRPPQYSQGDQGAPPPPPYGGSPQYQGGPQFREQPPPPQQRTAKEQFQDSIGIVKTAVDAIKEVQEMMPGMFGQAPSEGPEAEEDDSPIRIVDTGAGKIAYSKTDGSLRVWESGFSNLPGILKWFGEQRVEIQREARERQVAAPQAQPKQQLPPGFVEVHPGYVPPPGYVVVPVGAPPPQQQAPLPPPPTDLPPPISPQPPQWGAPTFPGSEGEG